jgi:UDP-N-acetylmuramoylalanine--D-glutamate ligase
MSAVKKTKSARRDLVLGLGATGLSIARYLRRSGSDALFADTREEPPGMQALERLWPGADVLLGETKLPRGIDRIIVSPGIADDCPLLRAARKAKVEVISDIEIFAREATAPFVAVTGSNGKSTVTTLLYHMCRASGRATLAGGNLGEPALDLLDEATPDLYVLELSSFQLQRTKTLPAAVAVLLNVSPDHLELVSFGFDEPADGHYGIRYEDEVAYLASGDTLLIAVSDLAMYGSHNQANALAALAAGDLLGLDMPAMLQVLNEFPGLPHRMQFVARKGAVNYINDSKATNVAAAVASIESVEGMLVLLAGGEGKGGDFSELAAAVEPKLRAAVLLGTDATAIADALDTVMPVYFAEDMQDAVSQAAVYAEPDDTVLLAPACASFDQFENYAARGDAFRHAVEALQR